MKLFKRSSKKTNWKMIAIIAGSAASLIPAGIRLARFLRDKLAERRAAAASGEEGSPMKAFSPAYRGKHKPHHRHAAAGQSGPELA
jgi:hypothetical protein